MLDFVLFQYVPIHFLNDEKRLLRNRGISLSNRVDVLSYSSWQTPFYQAYPISIEYNQEKKPDPKTTRSFEG